MIIGCCLGSIGNTTDFVYTEIQFKLGETENRVNESVNLVQLTVIRSGQFSEIYRPSVEYRIMTNESSTG